MGLLLSSALPAPPLSPVCRLPAGALLSPQCTWPVEQILHLLPGRDLPSLAAGNLEPRRDSSLPGSTQQSLVRCKIQTASLDHRLRGNECAPGSPSSKHLWIQVPNISHPTCFPTMMLSPEGPFSNAHLFRHGGVS